VNIVFVLCHWLSAVWQKGTNVSEKGAVSNFRITSSNMVPLLCIWTTDFHVLLTLLNWRRRQHVPPKRCCLLIELHGFTHQRNSLSSHHSENLNLPLKSSLVSLAPSFSVRSYLLALCKPGRAIELRAIHQSTSNTTRRVGFSKNWRTLMHEETSQLMAYCEKLSRYEMFGRTLMRILYQNW